MKIKQAVILAGGRGVRMRPFTFSMPKPMLLINGKPFLYNLLKLLKANGINEVIILVGYLHEVIENFFGDGRKLGLKIKYSYSPLTAHTGTRIKNALSLLEGTFLLVYGDNFWPLNLNSLTDFYEKMGVKAVITVYRNLETSTKNNIVLNDKNLVIYYDRKRKRKELNGVDIGFFILKKNIFKNLPQNDFSFENVILKRLIKEKQLAGFLTHHKYYSLTSPGRVPAINKYFKPKKVIFLDRDGVINKKPPQGEYITQWKEFIYLPKVKKSLKILKDKGYELFIISNQAGISRGKVSRETVDKINEKFLKELSDLGVNISGIYICPHGWNEGCFCRKPKPGLFFQSAREHDINLFESYFIGDDPRDMIAGELAGTKTIYLAKENKPQDGLKPFMIVKNLYQAAIKL